jgi:toxin ParE1/3/4
MTISYTAEAQWDRSHIWLESAQRFGPAHADAHIARIEATLLKTIATFPSGGRLRPELGAGIRSFPVVPYVAFYRANARRVEILRILHGRRDVKEPLLSLLVAV